MQSIHFGRREIVLQAYPIQHFLGGQRDLHRTSACRLRAVKEDAAYLETCRVKRNKAEYDMAGVATDQDASELLEFCSQLRKDVLAWLREHRPKLVEGEDP